MICSVSLKKAHFRYKTQVLYFHYIDTQPWIVMGLKESDTDIF